MSFACLRRHQSYASLRLEVFQLLFGPASVRSPGTSVSNPRNQLRNGKAQHRCFGISSKLSKQKGSRNVENDAELLGFMGARLVHDAPNPHLTPSTPAPPPQEPTKKQGSTDETRPWSPYRPSVQEELKALVRELKTAASEAQLFEQDFLTNPPKGAKVVKIDPDESRIPPGKDFFLRRITLDPEFGVRRLSLDLPESPVMRRLRKEKKHKRAPTDKELSALSNNTWASILASPVRLCQGTGVRLPSDLLVPWSFVRKRSTDATYLMPAALADMKTLKSLGGFKEESEPSEGPKGDDGAKSSDFSATSPSTKLMGKTTMLPYQPLVQKLTDKMIRRDTLATVNGTVQSILNQRVRASFNEAQHYAEDYKERKQMDLGSLQWQPDIPRRMMGIMRERVLTALESLGILNDSEQTIVPVPIKALETGRMVVVVGPAKDDAVSLKYSFKAAEAMPEPSPKVPHRKLAQLIHDQFAGSFLLHVNSSPVVIPDQPCAILSGIAPNLISQTISLNNTIRFPVFNLQQMMGFRERNGVATKHIALRYREVLRSSKVLGVPRLSSHPIYRNLQPSLGKEGQPLVQDQDSQNGPAYLLFVSSRAPMAQIVAKELWQLWRYQGGSVQQKKVTPVISTVPQAAEEIVDELEEVEDAERAPEQSRSTVWRDDLEVAPISISA